MRFNRCILLILFFGLITQALAAPISKKTKLSNKSKSLSQSSNKKNSSARSANLVTKKSKAIQNNKKARKQNKQSIGTFSKYKSSRNYYSANTTSRKSVSNKKLAKSNVSPRPALAKLTEKDYTYGGENVYGDNDLSEVSESYSVPYQLEEVANDSFSISHVGPFLNRDSRRYYEILPSGEKVVLTLDPDMQLAAESLLASYNLPYAAIVAIEPSTGRVKAMTGSSRVIKNAETLAVRSSFPAASLFKMITASAAVEKKGLASNTPINYRGGTYALGPHNYLPNAKSDRQVMTLAQAMGKSCNPVFARVALNYLSPNVIKQYASNFGFGKPLAYDFPLSQSTISLDSDGYSLARTAAGFGDAYISPVHAASIVAALGNNGMMMRPYIVEGVVLGAGKIRLLNNSIALKQVVKPSTSSEILTMMESTVTEGTARKHFRIASPALRDISVAAKTGTLRGPNPKGTYHWFTAVAPVENPRIAISALVIDNGRAQINGAGLGRRFLDKIFSTRDLTESAEGMKKAAVKPVS